MPSLSNDSDVKKTKKSFDSDSHQLKFDEGSRHAVYLLSDNYGEGYVHWVEIDGRRVQVPCGGGIEGKGFAPSDCCLCSAMSDGYKEAKEISKLDETAGKNLKTKMNSMRAKYSAKFLAAQGDALYVKRPDDSKVLEPDWDNVKVGYLNLTEAQFNALISISDGKEYSYMKGLGDLLNRAILTSKKKQERDGKTDLYPTMSFIPEDHQSDRPNVEFNPEDFDVNGDFVIDEAKLKDALDSVFNGAGSEPDDSDLEFEETATATTGASTGVDLSDIETDESFDDFDDFPDDDPAVDPEVDAKSRGFASLEEITRLVAKVCTDSKEKLDRLKNWEIASGSKSALAAVFKLNKQ